MRFLCEQCKAKYQISDDKVAGKTVRMKCRKCGHMIEVRSDVTETSVANANPAPVAQPVAAAAAAKPGTLPRPATKPIPPRSKLATNLTSSPPPKAAPQNPSALAGAFQRTVAGAPASSMRPAQNPDDSQALDMLSASANPWYVAINGVPVGPVRLSELRRKAQSGIVTESSLVWQEGVEEWRPVKTFPELAQIVREAAASGRPSLVPSAGERVSQMPSAPHASTRPAAAAPARQQPGAPRALVGPGAAPARNNVVAIGSRSAAAEQLDDDLDFEVDDRDKTTVDVGHMSPAPAAVAPGTRPSLVAPDPFAVPPAAAPMVAAAHQGNFGGTLVLPGGPSAPAPVFMEMSPGANAVANPYRAAAPISIAPAGLTPKRQVNVIALALIFAATAFGITAAVVVFSRPVPIAPVASAAPALSAAPTASASIAASDLPPPSSADPVDSAIAITTPDRPGTHSSGGGKTPAAGTTAKAVDPSIAALLHGEGSGPSIGGGGAGPSAGTSALSGSEIEAVVNNRKVGVTRTCWERNNGNLASANVTVHATIAANGTVSSSQADGSDPVVAKCIETQVKSWTFPPSSGSTPVVLPFHFVRQ